MKRIIFVALALLLIASVASANTIHTVKQGETLDKIAKKYNTSVNSIIKANSTPNYQLSSRKLKIGMKLKIPTKEQTTTALRTSQTTQTNASSKYHIVKKNDTIYSIANTYGISVSELKSLNNLSSNKLKPGTKLMVKQPQPTVYVASEGDTLQSIASRFNKSVEELLMNNELEENTPIMPGQKIYLTSEPIDADVAVVAALEKVTAEQKIQDAKMYSKSEDLLELSIQDRLILFAKKMLHIPYQFGGNGIWGIDCSGFVKKVYEIAGITLPRSARQQFGLGQKVDKDALDIGDLVFFRTYASFPSHVGIYIGNNLFIHASPRSKKVVIDSLDTPYFVKRYIGARRLIETSLQEGDIFNSEVSKDKGF